MGSDSSSRGFVRVGALAPDRSTRPDHDHRSRHPLSVTPEPYRLVRHLNHDLAVAPTTPEGFFALIAQLSLREFIPRPVLTNRWHYVSVCSPSAKVTADHQQRMA